MKVSCDSAAAMFDCDVPPIRLGPVPGEPGFFFMDTRETLAGPLWVKSRHFATREHVRYTPESGH